MARGRRGAALFRGRCFLGQRQGETLLVGGASNPGRPWLTPAIPIRSQWKMNNWTHALYRHVRASEDLLEANESRLLSPRSRIPRIVLSSDNDLSGEEELLGEKRVGGEALGAGADEKAGRARRAGMEEERRRVMVDLVVPTRKQVRAVSLEVTSIVQTSG